MHKDMKEILFKELGAQISKDYEGKKLLLIGLLKGSIPFLAELSKYIEGDVYFDYMSVSSYKGTESGTIHIKKDVDIDVKGMDDTVTHMLKDRGTASCEIVTMLDKQEARKYPVQAKYVGFPVPELFVVGYGLDFDQRFRNLPYIGILKEECYQ